jgi:hypothetical protein
MFDFVLAVGAGTIAGTTKPDPVSGVKNTISPSQKIMNISSLNI